MKTGQPMQLYSNAILTKPVKQAQLFKVVQEQLKLQVAKTPLAPIITARPDGAVTEELSVEFAARHPLTILIAEDNLVNQKLAIMILTKLGYKPDLAETGFQAVQMLEKIEYDLILMDMRMPEMDGLEATKYIRMSEAYQPVIIAMTANAMKEDRDLCIASGMNYYISKPIKIETLVNVLVKVADNAITATSA